jgi:hypothetical protein
MSGDTVTGRALQFTNDNKHAYAYSGAIASASGEIVILDFDTNSEYIIAKFQPFYRSDSGNNITYRIKFNNIEIAGIELTSSRDYTPYDEIHLIIPPFTKVTVTHANLSGGTNEAGLNVTGKVGMAQRVGNLDE